MVPLAFAIGIAAFILSVYEADVDMKERLRFSSFVFMLEAVISVLYGGQLIDGYASTFSVIAGYRAALSILMVSACGDYGVAMPAAALLMHLSASLWLAMQDTFIGNPNQSVTSYYTLMLELAGGSLLSQDPSSTSSIPILEVLNGTAVGVATTNTTYSLHQVQYVSRLQSLPAGITVFVLFCLAQVAFRWINTSNALYAQPAVLTKAVFRIRLWDALLIAVACLVSTCLLITGNNSQGHAFTLLATSVINLLPPMAIMLLKAVHCVHERESRKLQAVANEQLKRSADENETRRQFDRYVLGEVKSSFSVLALGFERLRAFAWQQSSLLNGPQAASGQQSPGGSTLLLCNQQSIETLQFMQQSMESTRWFIDGVLSLGKMQAGRYQMYFTPVALYKILRYASVQLQPVAQARRVHLTFECRSSVPELVLADFSRVTAMLLHLCSNGLKHARQGGGGTVNVRLYVLRRATAPLAQRDILAAQSQAREQRYCRCPLGAQCTAEAPSLPPSPSSPQPPSPTVDTSVSPAPASTASSLLHRLLKRYTHPMSATSLRKDGDLTSAAAVAAVSSLGSRTETLSPSYAAIPVATSMAPAATAAEAAVADRAKRAESSPVAIAEPATSPLSSTSVTISSPSNAELMRAVASSPASAGEVATATTSSSGRLKFSLLRVFGRPACDIVKESAATESAADAVFGLPEAGAAFYPHADVTEAEGVRSPQTKKRHPADLLKGYRSRAVLRRATTIRDTASKASESTSSGSRRAASSGSAGAREDSVHTSADTLHRGSEGGDAVKKHQRETSSRASSAAVTNQREQQGASTTSSTNEAAGHGALPESHNTSPQRCTACKLPVGSVGTAGDTKQQRARLLLPFHLKEDTSYRVRFQQDADVTTRSSSWVLSSSGGDDSGLEDVNDYVTDDVATVRFEVSDNGPGLHPEVANMVVAASLRELLSGPAAEQQPLDAGIGVASSQDAVVALTSDRAPLLSSTPPPLPPPAYPPELGLGLFVCRQFAERHGGRLGTSSTAGTGSTFFVELPLRVLKQPHHSSPPASSPLGEAFALDRRSSPTPACPLSSPALLPSTGGVSQPMGSPVVAPSPSPTRGFAAPMLAVQPSLNLSPVTHVAPATTAVAAVSGSPSIGSSSVSNTHRQNGSQQASSSSSSLQPKLTQAAVMRNSALVGEGLLLPSDSAASVIIARRPLRAGGSAHSRTAADSIAAAPVSEHVSADSHASRSRGASLAQAPPATEIAASRQETAAPSALHHHHHHHILGAAPPIAPPAAPAVASQFGGNEMRAPLSPNGIAAAASRRYSPLLFTAGPVVGSSVAAVPTAHGKVHAQAPPHANSDPARQASAAASFHFSPAIVEGYTTPKPALQEVMVLIDGQASVAPAAGALAAASAPSPLLIVSRERPGGFEGASTSTSDAATARQSAAGLDGTSASSCESGSGRASETHGFSPALSSFSPSMTVFGHAVAATRRAALSNAPSEPQITPSANIIYAENPHARGYVPSDFAAPSATPAGSDIMSDRRHHHQAAISASAPAGTMPLSTGVTSSLQHQHHPRVTHMTPIYSSVQPGDREKFLRGLGQHGGLAAAIASATANVVAARGSALATDGSGSSNAIICAPFGGASQHATSGVGVGNSVADAFRIHDSASSHQLAAEMHAGQGVGGISSTSSSSSSGISFSDSPHPNTPSFALTQLDTEATNTPRLVEPLYGVRVRRSQSDVSQGTSITARSIDGSPLRCIISMAEGLPRRKRSTPPKSTSSSVPATRTGAGGELSAQRGLGGLPNFSSAVSRLAGPAVFSMLPPTTEQPSGCGVAPSGLLAAPPTTQSPSLRPLTVVSGSPAVVEVDPPLPLPIMHAVPSVGTAAASPSAGLVVGGGGAHVSGVPFISDSNQSSSGILAAPDEIPFTPTAAAIQRELLADALSSTAGGSPLSVSAHDASSASPALLLLGTSPVHLLAPLTTSVSLPGTPGVGGPGFVGGTSSGTDDLDAGSLLAPHPAVVDGWRRGSSSQWDVVTRISSISDDLPHSGSSFAGRTMTGGSGATPAHDVSRPRRASHGSDVDAGGGFIPSLAPSMSHHSLALSVSTVQAMGGAPATPTSRLVTISSSSPQTSRYPSSPHALLVQQLQQQLHQHQQVPVPPQTPVGGRPPHPQQAVGGHHSVSHHGNATNATFSGGHGIGEAPPNVEASVQRGGSPSTDASIGLRMGAEEADTYGRGTISAAGHAQSAMVPSSAELPFAGVTDPLIGDAQYSSAGGGVRMHHGPPPFPMMTPTPPLLPPPPPLSVGSSHHASNGVGLSPAAWHLVHRQSDPSDDAAAASHDVRAAMQALSATDLRAASSAAFRSTSPRIQSGGGGGGPSDPVSSLVYPRLVGYDARDPGDSISRGGDILYAAGAIASPAPQPAFASHHSSSSQGFHTSIHWAVLDVESGRQSAMATLGGGDGTLNTSDASGGNAVGYRQYRVFHGSGDELVLGPQGSSGSSIYSGEGSSSRADNLALSLQGGVHGLSTTSLLLRETELTGRPLRDFAHDVVDGAPSGLSTGSGSSVFSGFELLQRQLPSAFVQGGANEPGASSDGASSASGSTGPPLPTFTGGLGTASKMHPTSAQQQNQQMQLHQPHLHSIAPPLQRLPMLALHPGTQPNNASLPAPASPQQQHHPHAVSVAANPALKAPTSRPVPTSGGRLWEAQPQVRLHWQRESDEDAAVVKVAIEDGSTFVATTEKPRSLQHQQQHNRHMQQAQSAMRLRHTGSMSPLAAASASFAGAHHPNYVQSTGSSSPAPPVEQQSAQTVSPASFANHLQQPPAPAQHQHPDVVVDVSSMSLPAYWQPNAHELGSTAVAGRSLAATAVNDGVATAIPAPAAASAHVAYYNGRWLLPAVQPVPVATTTAGVQRQPYLLPPGMTSSGDHVVTGPASSPSDVARSIAVSGGTGSRLHDVSGPPYFGVARPQSTPEERKLQPTTLMPSVISSANDDKDDVRALHIFAPLYVSAASSSAGATPQQQQALSPLDASPPAPHTVHDRHYHHHDGLGHGRDSHSITRSQPQSSDSRHNRAPVTSSVPSPVDPTPIFIAVHPRSSPCASSSLGTRAATSSESTPSAGDAAGRPLLLLPQAPRSCAADGNGSAEGSSVTGPPLSRPTITIPQL